MARDILFMLGPYFEDGAGRKRYCADSVAVEGLLSFFPILRKKVDVQYLDAVRPRHALVELLGEENQSLPVLVVNDSAMNKNDYQTQTAKGRLFISSEVEIRRYLTVEYTDSEPG